MPEPIRLALVWHMHQPSYRDAETGRLVLPWTRLHATKDYRDMATLLSRYPGVHATFNLTPILLEQLDEIAAGASDPYLDAARIDAEALSEDDRRFLLARFFDVHHERMLAPHPRYRELFEKARSAEERSIPNLEARDWRDLQVWFHLAWVDPSYRDEEPLSSAMRKGRDFTEAEKHAVLDWGVACAGSVAGVYRALEATGQVELSTSAYHHPILPLLIDSDAPREQSTSIRLPDPPFRRPEDAREQIERAARSHTLRFGIAPRGMWPPEGAVNQATLAALAAAGFRWAASDEAVLAAAIAGRGGDDGAWPAPLYRPHRVDTASGPIEMIFRDRMLSDLIGFTYAHWDPRDAATDFVNRVRGAGRALPEGESALVTVILDGENCWESYADDGIPFLSELYRMLEADPEIEAVTVSEALARVPTRSRLDRVPVGSWIRADLAIWVGHEEKNRAWAELNRARRAVADSAAGGSAAANAMEEIYAAEASDWFWWYGDDHPTVHRETFDRLFRSRLLRAYRHLGMAAPRTLSQSLRTGGPGKPDARGAERGARDVPFIRPTVDGRETDFFEWRDAVLYDMAGAAGTMHRGSGALRAVRFGTDGTELYVRVDLEGGGPIPDGDASIAILLEGGDERLARIPLASAGSGAPSWTGGGVAAPGRDPGAYALGSILEVRLSLDACGWSADRTVRFRVLLERGNRSEEVAPHAGWLELSLPPEDPRVALWSAL